MPMNQIILLTILILTHFDIYANSPFSEVEPFFDLELFKQGHKKEEFKKKTCPDGSKFLSLSFREEEQKEISEATCYYPDGDLALVIEHVWIDGVKSFEYSTVEGMLHGKVIEKMRDGLYFISEYCYDRILKTEAQLDGEVVTIGIYGKDQIEPESFLYINEPKLNVNPQSASNYKHCENKFKISNKQFINWQEWKWTDYSKLTVK